MGLKYSEIPKWISDRGISDALHTQMSMQKVVKPPQNEGFIVVLEVKTMCKYCEENESIFYDRNSEGIREVVVEQDNTLNICSNDYDREDMKKSMAIGFSFGEASKMAQYSISLPINYCPICGRKLVQEDVNECGNDIKDIIQEKIEEYSCLGNIAKVEAYWDCLDIINNNK